MRTPLHSLHLKLGARMVEFAGWQMPVQYAGIIREHQHTRTSTSLFDTCHMSEFEVRGPDAGEALQRALACRIRELAIGRCRYGFLLDGAGGVLDDLVCYRLEAERYMLVANAATRDRDARTLQERLEGEAAFEDISDATGKVDLQGPESLKALERVADGPVSGLRYYEFARMKVAGVEALVSRTGYTGELGYELYVEAGRVADVWEALLAIEGVEPAGLGARDTLRLEMGYPLYGHELTEAVTPLNARLERALPEGGYLGAEALARRRREGVGPVLVGIEFEGRRAARPGDRLFAEGAEAGRVTSGSYAPSLGRAVALGYVRESCAVPGSPVEADVRGRRVAGRVARLPFHKRGTARMSTVRRHRG